MNALDENLQFKYPNFSNELIDECRQSGDFRPILFEWYKSVGIFCIQISCILPDSSGIQNIPSVHFAVLVGLLNRCARLMLANIRLSSSGKYGETTKILDRSLSESAIRVQWLCHKNNSDGFVRYLADGLKNDLILKEQIERNIQNRNEDILIIEQRMLNSIQNSLELSGLSEKAVKDAKKMPDFASMCKFLDYDDIFYISIQRMGSHAVHGNWSDLIFNYLKYENQRFFPRDHEVPTQDAQFIVVIHLVLGAIESFLRYVVSDVPERSQLIAILHEVDEKVTEIRRLAWDLDFKISQKSNN